MSSGKDIHLVILVHGIWGVPAHMEYLESQIHHIPEEKEAIVTYKTTSHSKFFTYDGIDVNGKRVRDEIIAERSSLEGDGNRVTKLSIVAYSFGGLISRYAVGILDDENFFDEVTPVNFVTFCTPHVGVPTTKTSRVMKIYDWLAPKFLAATGDQIFLCDNERGNIDGPRGKPLLVWMADPSSKFYKALKKFQHLALYANAINDRRTAWYTASISKLDPFHSIHNKDPSRIHAHYLTGYEPTVIDRSKEISFGSPVVSEKHVKPSSSFTWFLRKWRWFKVFGEVVVFAPILGIHFIINSIFQRVQHSRRISSFYRDNSLKHMYHPNPSFVDHFTSAISDERDKIVEDAYQAIHTTDVNESADHNSKPVKVNLTADQQYVVDNLNTLPWNKYPVLIRQTMSTHSAAIYRQDDPTFFEGKTVVQHFIDNVFKHN